MLWIALALSSDTAPSPSGRLSLEAQPDPADLQALCWWALQFSPRVCVLEQAVLLEVQASTRLFGSKKALLNRVRAECREPGGRTMAVAPTALAALALLRHGEAHPPQSEGSESPDVAATIPALYCAPRQLQTMLDGLPITSLSAVAQHAETLLRLGCQTLGQVREQLPRGGLSRRFGAGLLDALDRAYGLKTETYSWITLPEQFSVRLEFSGRIEVAQGLMFGANRLLGQLKIWLTARQSGVTGLVLHWEHDLQRRGELKAGRLEVRTAEATRDTVHLTRLLAEHLGRTVLTAPVVAIGLEVLGVEVLRTISTSLLPEDRTEGETLQQLIERLSARLGPDRVLHGEAVADHRPHQMQRWDSATGSSARKTRCKPVSLPGAIALQPPWILRQPMRLALVRERPFYQGPLVLLAGPDRLEAGWWITASASTPQDDLALRDYFVAESEHAGLLWIYRQRTGKQLGWYLHGIYG